MKHFYRIFGTAKINSKPRDVDYVVNNIQCDEDNQFTKYMGDQFEEGLFDGDHMHFFKIAPHLMVAVDYQTTRELTKKEQDDLLRYTSGQLSDGIGEGFEQRPCGYYDHDDPIYVSPWHLKQTLVIREVAANQVDITPKEE